MHKSYIDIAGKWAVVFAYGIRESDEEEVSSWLEALSCPAPEIEKACHVIRKPNTGFTYTNDRLRMSVCCIGRATSFEQFCNTIVHESDHIQEKICEHYDVPLGGEEAAYLQGYIIERVARSVLELT